MKSPVRTVPILAIISEEAEDYFQGNKSPEEVSRLKVKSVLGQAGIKKKLKSADIKNKNVYGANGIAVSIQRNGGKKVCRSKQLQ